MRKKIMDIIKGGGVCTPLGFNASAVNGDVKGNGKDNNDICLLVSDVPMKVGGVFTTNNFKAAPVKYCMSLLKDKKEFRGILVNSGNANACTGAEGIKACVDITDACEKELGFDTGEILNMSTGVIGVQMPVQRFYDKTEELADNLSGDNGNLFAEAIMTTDTFTKEAAVLVETENGAFVVGGCAKGAGMIAPHMATMLGFITTDAMVSAENLEKCAKEAVKDSFNSITVDGDMSTNDSVFIMANGMSGIIPNNDLFLEAVKLVSLELAKMIVKDGEGATKFVTINVEEADSYEDASKCAFMLANSPLVKTMFAGEDPNWGRLVATVGASRIKADEELVDLWFNDLKYVEGGMIIDPELEKQAAEIMQGDEIIITVKLGMGEFSKTVYTCDLTKDYVAINADYRT